MQHFPSYGEGWGCLGLPWKDEISPGSFRHGTIGTSELAEGSGAVACVYVVAGEGVGEDASPTGIKEINFKKTHN